MKQPPEGIARCSGRYNFYTTDTCPDRETCLRYLAFRHETREHYRGIPVMQAVANCEMKMEAAE